VRCHLSRYQYMYTWKKHGKISGNFVFFSPKKFSKWGELFFPVYQDISNYALLDYAFKITIGLLSLKGYSIRKIFFFVGSWIIASNCRPVGHKCVVVGPKVKNAVEGIKIGVHEIVVGGLNIFLQKSSHHTSYRQNKCSKKVLRNTS